MASIVVLYNRPADPAAFDEYYTATHVPIAKKIPGLVSYEISKGGVMTPEGPSPYHMVAILNGVEVLNFTDPTPKSFDGYIALQLHSGGEGNMRFKDIYVRDLSVR